MTSNFCHVTKRCGLLSQSMRLLHVRLYTRVRILSLELIERKFADNRFCYQIRITRPLGLLKGILEYPLQSIHWSWPFSRAVSLQTCVGGLLLRIDNKPRSDTNFVFLRRALPFSVASGRAMTRLRNPKQEASIARGFGFVIQLTYGSSSSQGRVDYCSTFSPAADSCFWRPILLLERLTAAFSLIDSPSCRSR